MFVFALLTIFASVGTAFDSGKYQLPLDATGELPAFVKDFLVPPPTGAFQNASKTRPLVYLYDIVDRYQELNGDNVLHHLGGYANDFEFEEYLLASKYVTKNPEEADFFYFRIHMYWGKHVDILEIIDKFRTMGPWYDRKNGKDHIVYMVDDYGGCKIRGALTTKKYDLLIISQFGRVYAQDHDTYTPCRVVPNDAWADGCDPMLALSSGSLRADQPCHITGHDIVVPPPEFEVPKSSLYFNKKLIYENRTTLFFYAGLIDLHENNKDALEFPESDAYYSSGVRQTVYRLFHNEPGFKFYTKSRAHNYSEELSNSMFCLAALGWGWGGRMKAAISAGCIPVVIAPYNRVEWEEQLPLKEYAIRVPLWMVHKLPQILHAIVKSGRAKRLQRNLWCVWRLHWWHRPHGRAFEVTMCELKRRVLYAAVPEQDRHAGHPLAKIRFDLTSCTLYCGDDVPIYVPTAPIGFA